MDNIQFKVYPEFGGLTGEEISIRLQVLDNLLNLELETELIKEDLMQNMGTAVVVDSPTDEAPAEMTPMGKEATDFLVIAHRGWSGSYPENTLIGMREAIKLGVHMIEFDVAMTRDRKPIIIHDSSLQRTTNGIGIVAEHDYAELRKLDAGSWFHPAYAGTRLPSLDEILLISRSNGIRVNIEIKAECWEDELQPDGIEHQVIAAIKRHRVLDRVLVSSFHWPFIERIRRIDESIPTALLLLEDPGDTNPRIWKDRYGATAINPFCGLLAQKDVDRIHEAGMQVYTFTINTYLDMEKYLDMGVDGMFTNHPNRLFGFIKEHHQRMTHFEKREAHENIADVEAAIRRLELEELEKARRRTRWRVKRHLLSERRSHDESAGDASDL